MATEIRVPTLGESVTEATVGKWLKKAGDTVKADEPLVELETDKVTVEVPAPAAGQLAEIKAAEGTTVAIGAVLGAINESAAGAVASGGGQKEAPAKAAPAPKPEPAPAARAAPVSNVIAAVMPASPAARKQMAEAGLQPGEVAGTGRRGQVLKGDVTAAAKLEPAACSSAT